MTCNVSPLRPWQRDKAATDVFLPTIKSIMGRIVFVEDLVEDRERNSDLIVLAARGTRIAVRVRRAKDRARYGHQFTIRKSRPSGTKTELEKIADGWGDWFFYGFGDYDTGKLVQYVVVDLDAFRRRLIVNDPPVLFEDLDNRDGSSTFRAYDVRSFGGRVVVKQWSAAE